MNRSNSREPLFKDFFGLTESHALKRVQWIFLLYGLVWVSLSGLDILIHFFVKEQRSLTIALMSFIKYLPILAIPYFTARKKAAAYLTDIFELKDITISEDFLSHIAFGSGFAKITIDEGNIQQGDQNSSILLIGGPGYVQVNLDNVAVSELTNGTPKILLSRAKPWQMEGFERMREIGMDGDNPRYAIIDLMDQFIKNITVSTRTKDGIPIEAHDIKIIFSVIRKDENNGDISEIHSVNEEAVHSLVYKQTVLVGGTKTEKVRAGFPWDSTILPLVMGELEDLIMKNTLNEILANIGQKELDQTNEAEQKINNLKTELTGQQQAVARVNKMPDFLPRSKITERFYEPEFYMKAAALGVHLIWIDIGTWKLPSSIILEKHKDAWQLARDNASKRAGIEHKKVVAKRREFLELINDVVFAKFDRTTQFKEFSSLKTESLADLRRLLERKPEDIAQDILRAFRKELLAAQYMLTSKKEIYEKNQSTVEAIRNAIQHINPYI